MPRIGIINCSTMKELGCPVNECFKAIRNRTGEFENNEDQNEDIELVGVVSCSGCPTISAYERISINVRSLVEAGAEVVHLSTCIKTLCPFKNKYKTILEERYPDTIFKMGTHSSTIKGVDEDTFVKLMREHSRAMLVQPRQTWADIIKIVKEQQ